MKSMISSQCFSFIRHLFYEEISPKFNEKALKYLMNTIYIFFEKTFVHFEIISSMYLKLYDEITDNEIKLAHIQSNDKVLVIGSGSIPATAVLIVRKTGAQVLGIDRDYQAVMRGNQYAQQHHIGANLKIIRADGSAFNISPYDVIIVAYGIQDEPQLFSSITGHMKLSTRIIYRQPYNQTFTSTSLPDFISSSFEVQNKMISQSLGSIYSLLFVKKGDTPRAEQNPK